MATKLETLGFFNWILYIDFLVVSLVISIYVFIVRLRTYEVNGHSISNVAFYILAERDLHFIPAALTYFGAFFSSITVLGIPGEIYSYGMSYAFISIGYTISCIVACVFFNPVFYDMKLFSVYEYIGLRFSRISQIFCSIGFIIQMLLYLGIVLYVPALTFSTVVDVNKWLIVVTLAFIGTIYSTLGGLKAIVYTTMFQIVLLYLGLLPILIKGNNLAGGLSKLWENAKAEGRLDLNGSFDMRQRCTVPGMIIGGAFLWMAMNCASQTTVQRINACRTKTYTKLTIFLNIILMNTLLLILVICGLIICFKYKDEDNDPSESINAEAFIIRFVLDELQHYPGIMGLFLVCIMSASLSSISSGLNSLSAVTLRNIFPFLSYTMDDTTSYSYLRFCTLVYGLVIMWFAYLSSLSENILNLAYSIFGVISGPILGVFFLGLFLPMCNFKGAFIGHIFAQILLLWITIGKLSTGITYFTYGQNVTSVNNPRSILNKDKKPLSGLENFYAISIYWYSFIGCILTVILGLFVSCLTKSNMGKIEVPKIYITPLLREFWKNYLDGNQNQENVFNKINIKKQPIQNEISRQIDRSSNDTLN